jgi:hypothetical protein
MNQIAILKVKGAKIRCYLKVSIARIGRKKEKTCHIFHMVQAKNYRRMSKYFISIFSL